MRCGEAPTVDDAIKEIAGLLALAYKRYSGIRLVPTTPERLRSTGELAIPRLDQNADILLGKSAERRQIEIEHLHKVDWVVSALDEAKRGREAASKPVDAPKPPTTPKLPPAETDGIAKKKQ